MKSNLSTFSFLLCQFGRISYIIDVFPGKDHSSNALIFKILQVRTTRCQGWNFWPYMQGRHGFPASYFNNVSKCLSSYTLDPLHFLPLITTFRLWCRLFSQDGYLPHLTDQKFPLSSQRTFKTWVQSLPLSHCKFFISTSISYRHTFSIHVALTSNCISITPISAEC